MSWCIEFLVIKKEWVKFMLGKFFKIINMCKLFINWVIIGYSLIFKFLVLCVIINIFKFYNGDYL